MKIKKFHLQCLILIVALGLVLAGCSSSSSTSSTSSDSNSDKTIRIGAIWDVTGAGSALGVPERNALRMLVEKTNENGGINGKKVELIESDNQSNETKALTDAKRMISQEKVVAIIGGAQSTTSLSMVPTIESEGVPYISNGSNRGIINGKKWAFLTPPSDEVLITTILKDAQKNGIKKMAMIRVNNDFGKSGEEAFKKNASKYGLEVTGVEQFNADAKDVKVQLNKLITDKPDALIVWSVVPGSAAVAKDFFELGYSDKLKLYASSGTVSQKFIELAGKGSEGVIMPTYKLLVADQLSKDDPQYKIVTEFKEAYEAKYDDELSQFPSNAADAWYLLEDAIKRAGDNVSRKTIRDNLESTKGLVGQIGEYQMTPDDHNGLDGSGLILVKVENGKFVPYGYEKK
ncbi:ABC transporter substrate-binding protein [Neobacillus mesonae]|uniref:ABC transporter substrate-binding protein n=1 Tax=Neobacillus mesonae TaxID=1193713 RepID=UPI0020424733|nr:ABC transporter substrate-binding protein [Neobacillus mesonae]MCM3568100.1 ABC transporter substrate-binding protein [Neobacillus mesonae]